MTNPNPAAVQRGNAMTPDEVAKLIEEEERIAIRQECCNKKIDVVPRDTKTGKLTESKGARG